MQYLAVVAQEEVLNWQLRTGGGVDAAQALLPLCPAAHPDSPLVGPALFLVGLADPAVPVLVPTDTALGAAGSAVGL